MKKSIFYFFILAVFLGGCLAEQENPLVVPRCDDGIRNQDEEDIDCGGHCVACIPFIPIVTPCDPALAVNRVVIDGFNINMTPDYYSCTQESDYFRIHILKDYQEAELLFDVRPAHDAIYQISSGIPQPGVCILHVFNLFNEYRPQGGEAYVHVSDGEFTVEICPMSLRYVGFESYIDFEASITCH